MIHKADIIALPEPLALEGGTTLTRASVAYESYGAFGRGRPFVMLHGMTDSHHALSTQMRGGGWGSALLGPKQLLDPSEEWVLSLNLLGSPFGSTSAIKGCHDTLTIEDMARAVIAACTALGAPSPRAIIGVGLGGMVALKAVSLVPSFADGVLTFGTAMVLPSALRAQLGMASQLIRAGGYRKCQLDWLRASSGRESLTRQFGSAVAVDAHLSQAADQRMSDFDGACFAQLAVAYAAADLKSSLAAIRARVMLIAGSSDDVAPPSLVRDTYHRLGAGTGNPSFYEMTHDGGHEDLMQHATQLKGPLRDFLRIFA